MAERVVFVAGTATGVGKTWVAARLLSALGDSGRAFARKPVQSFEEGDRSTDAHLLGAATGEPAEEVCPPHRWYARALAPPIAAQVLGQPPWRIEDLVAETRLPARGTVVVEGVGGPRSPVADDGDSATLARALRCDLVVLVADAGLGAINACLTSVACFARTPVIVFLNRYVPTDTTHERNLAWLRDRSRLTVVTEVDELVAALGEPAHSLAGTQPTVEVT